MKLANIFTSLLVAASFSSLYATVYEDAEDSSSARWSIYDNTPAGATVQNIIEADGNRAIQLIPGEGAGSNGYMIGAIGGIGKWSNTTEKNMRWHMKFGQYYTIYIPLETEKGQRYLKYTPVNSNAGDLGNGYFHLGLGSNSDNGEWTEIVRDLEADLSLVDPGNRILAVNGFLVRGEGLIDDLELHSNKPLISDKLYEDAEDGTIDNWIVYDAQPAGATITNVYEDATHGKVISLQGDATNNGYMFGNWLGRVGAWAELDRKTITWDMKYSESYAFFITVQTEQGRRYMYYNTSNQDRGIVNEKYIHHGIGGAYMDGKWHTLSLNLEQDLQEYEPENHITSVNGLLVRGSGKIDNVILSDGIPNLPDTVYEDAEVGLANWVTVIGNSDPLRRYTENDGGHNFVKLTPHWQHLENGNWKNNAEYHLPLNNRTQKILSVDVGGDGQNMPHYLLGVRTTTLLGPRIILWDSFYTHEGLSERISYYGASSATLIFPSEKEQVRGFGYADVNLWETHRMDLEQSLHFFEPENSIISVDYFIASGGNLDNLKLQSQ